MRISRLGVLAVVAVMVSLGSGCSFYNRVMARKNLVDGAKAYKDRKFPEAEERFRYAASLDPEGETLEGRTAQLSLARTLHSEYIGNRSDKGKAQEAIDAYKKSLPQFLKELKETEAAYNANPTSPDTQKMYLNSLSSVNSSSSAIASLYDNIQQPDNAQAWLEQVSKDQSYPATARARAFSALAAKQNTCANEISDTPATKKTVPAGDGKQAYQFVKPADPAQFTKLQQCTADGMAIIDQAMALEPQSVKDAGSLNPDSMSDVELALTSEFLKIFQSVRSYKVALINQQVRIAEMNGDNAGRDKLKAEYETAKEALNALGDKVQKIDDVIEARAAAKEAAEAANAANANGSANAAANANK
ncbi:MAG: hypothetical protein JFAIHJKO_02611 [Pyrinomonadaceae bacterium]|nr:hypothetical protein [Pyrinomonadaceae bacterium]